jgi:hypothetical protein
MLRKAGDATELILIQLLRNTAALLAQRKIQTARPIIGDYQSIRVMSLLPVIWHYRKPFRALALQSKNNKVQNSSIGRGPLREGHLRRIQIDPTRSLA